MTSICLLASKETISSMTCSDASRTDRSDTSESKLGWGWDQTLVKAENQNIQALDQPVNSEACLILTSGRVKTHNWKSRPWNFLRSESDPLTEYGLEYQLKTHVVHCWGHMWPKEQVGETGALIRGYKSQEENLRVVSCGEARACHLPSNCALVSRLKVDSGSSFDTFSSVLSS